jgi:hypothetical protein
MKPPISRMHSASSFSLFLATPPCQSRRRNMRAWSYRRAFYSIRRISEIFLYLAFIVIPLQAFAQQIRPDRNTEKVDQKSMLLMAQQMDNLASEHQLLANQTLGSTAYPASVHLLYERYPLYYCYAAALALGHAERARQVVRPYLRRNVESKFDLVDELLKSSLEYSNIAEKIRHVAAQSYSELTKNWDLQCAGQYGFPANPTSTSKKAFFRVHDDILVILGDITAGFANRLDSALKSNPSLTSVALGSGGGAVYEAIAAGKLLRLKGITTRLYSNCYSACPLVFLGGADRIVMAGDTYRFGFHQVSIEGAPIDLRARTYMDISQYISEMGGDARTLLSLMHRKLPHEMFEITAHSEISCTLRLATFVQRICL